MTTTTEVRNPVLDQLADRIYVEFYDPTGSRYGFPTFPFRYAPDGLATRRQLRAAGLRPTHLYRLDLAAPKRAATPAQLAAVHKALLARRTCRHCGVTRPYYIPRSTGACLTCEPGGPS